MIGSRTAWRLAIGAASLVPWLVACGGHSLYLRPGTATCMGCAASADDLDVRVVLIGDAGEADRDNANLALLEEVAGAVPARTTVLFLGDNVYPRGLPAAGEPGAERERQQAEDVLSLWLNTVERSGAAAVFIPGNHDWRKGRQGGMTRVLEQERFVREHAADPRRVRSLPRDACPGPIVLDLGSHARVVIADTEWLLTEGQERGEDCTWGIEGEAASLGAGNEAFFAALAEAARGAGKRHMLFAAHHPLRTRGPHGGYFTGREFFFPLTIWKNWLYLPLPILYPVVRYGIVRNPQDMVSSRNRAMVEGIESALAAAPGAVLAAAGHDHALQVFDDGEAVRAVSGSGAHSDIAGVTDSTVFKHGAPGMMAVDYFRDGSVLLRVLEPRRDAPAVEVFGRWLVRR